MGFVELLGRSAFSFLKGASLPEEMVAAAEQQGLQGLALCDRGGTYGVVRAWAAARRSNFPLMIGAELALADPYLPVERSERLATTRTAPAAGSELPSIVLIAADRFGYHQLCRLITCSHAGLPKGHSVLEPEMLGECIEGLVALVPVTERRAQAEVVQAWLQRLHDCFGSRAAIAAFKRLDGRDDVRVNCARHWSAGSGLSVVASARPLFHQAERKPLADILYCIRTGTTLDAAGGRLQANAEAHLRSESEMRRLFAEHPEWVDRSVEIAEQLRFRLDELNYEFPCHLDVGETADARLRRCVEQGVAWRYPEGVPERVRIQLEKELRLIEQLRVAPYFLCTYEIIELARERRILCQGRGSAANSAVCYVLGITAVDPARGNLLFERFLSAERNEPPDIDIDFEHERREEVIQEIYRRYGRDHAAMVSEVICYRGKSALREVGKVFGLSLEQADRLASMITHWDGPQLDAGQLQEYGFDANDERLQQVVHWAKELCGFPRHLSIHVGGFVLSSNPIHQLAPIEPATMPGRTIIPWDKDDIETLGFFKVDVLGLGMLTAVRKALHALHADGVLRLPNEVEFDPIAVMGRVPPEDPAVYAKISEADTVGVFQIESRAQMAMLPRLRPQRFYDLVIEVAIVRPGPIQGGMVHPYLRRRNGEEPIRAPHPSLWPILERTLGVPLFQEQVMQLSIVGAGYTGGQADQLRRDMAAWRKTGRLLRHRERLIEGFVRNGISRRFAQDLFEQIKGFGDYGFPESHAASFALLVYLSAWQKTHFPAHFCCALLNSQPMGFYSPSSLVRDARNHGVEVLPIDVLESEWDCSLECTDSRAIQSRYPEAQRAVRLGFRLIKGLGRAAAERLVAARQCAPFRSFSDLLERAHLQKDEVEALAEAGALSAWFADRRRALWAARGPRGVGLFRGLALAESEFELPRASRSQQLMFDYERVGLSIRDHPIGLLRPRLRSLGALTATQLKDAEHHARVTLAGIVLSRQRPGTAAGVLFVTLEDETGVVNVVVFRQVYEKFELAARHAGVMLVEGKVERHLTEPRPGEVGSATPVIHLIADRLERLDRPGRGISVRSRDFR